MKDEALIIANLRSAKTLTKAQQALLALAEIGEKERSKEQQRDLAVLLKAEQAKLDAKMAEAKASHILKKQRSEAERQRTHKLIQLGALVELAGLSDKSAGELLGVMLASKQSEPARWETWKRNGDEVLASREKAKNRPSFNLADRSTQQTT